MTSAAAVCEVVTIERRKHLLEAEHPFRPDLVREIKKRSLNLDDLGVVGRPRGAQLVLFLLQSTL